ATGPRAGREPPAVSADRKEAPPRRCPGRENCRHRSRDGRSPTPSHHRMRPHGGSRPRSSTATSMSSFVISVDELYAVCCLLMMLASLSSVNGCPLKQGVECH